MRAAALLIALVGCTPEIVSGAYLCGPEEACPEGQTCNGSDGTCVATGTQSPFACETANEHEPDDTPAQALAIAGLSCVSSPYTDHGCLAAGDGQDWVKFKAPTGCTALQVDARVANPISWEPVGLELWNLDTMTMIAGDAECKQPAPTGSDSRCLTQTISSDVTYGVKVKPAGGGDCGGQCNFNRYVLTVQLSTPG